MKISLICVGTLKEKYLKEAVKEYSKRLSSYCNLEIIEVKEGRDKEAEGRGILKRIDERSFTTALDIDGKELDSEAFAKKIDQLPHEGISKLTFIIGGSGGLSQEVKESCDFRLSFSRMTFPHQLMRVIFLEQLYRTFKINRNEIYHK